MAKIMVKKLSLFTLAFMLSVYVILLFYYSGKIVHLSIDDTSVCMKSLTSDSSKYASLFDEPFLHKLRKIHNVTGAKFTLYIYERDGNYNMNQFPCKYLKEFTDNRNWLRLGFHAISPENTKTYYDDFKKAFCCVDSNLILKSGGAMSYTKATLLLCK